MAGGHAGGRAARGASGYRQAGAGSVPPGCPTKGPETWSNSGPLRSAQCPDVVPEARVPPPGPPPPAVSRGEWVRPESCCPTWCLGDSDLVPPPRAAGGPRVDQCPATLTDGETEAQSLGRVSRQGPEFPGSYPTDQAFHRMHPPLPSKGPTAQGQAQGGSPEAQDPPGKVGVQKKQSCSHQLQPHGTHLARPQLPCRISLVLNEPKH